MVNRDPTADVLCVQSPAGSDLRARLEEELESVRVGVVDESAATASPDLVEEGCDCLVVAVGDHGVSAEALTAVSAGSTPVVAFVDSDAESGTAAAALEFGATDVVTAGGPDQYTVLANRIERAVEHADTASSLEQLNARFEALANTPSLAVVTMDSTSTIQYASSGVERLFGYTADELAGESMTAIMPDRLEDAHHEAVSEYLETGEQTLDWRWIELPAKHRDGTEFPVAVTFGDRAGEDGHLFSAIIRDITDRRERQERLRRLATAIDEAMDGVAILDEDGAYEYVNDAHAELYGYDDTEELIGENWRSLYGEDERERFETEVFPTLAEEGVWSGEATGLREDGSTFAQDLSLTQLEDGGLVCVVRDISEKVRRRRELRDERQFIESVMDALPDAFYVIEPDGTFDRWNDRMAAVTGYTDEELDGMHATEVVPPEDRDLITRALSKVFTEREPQTVQSALLTKQGERIPHEFSGSHIVNAEDEVVGLAGIGRDVSTQRFRQKQLSVLSRVLRHNVRNRTSVVKGNAQYLKANIDDPALTEKLSAIEAAADELNTASTRARRAERLLEASGTTRETVDLVEAIERALADLDTGAATVETALPASAPALAIGIEPVRRAVEEVCENVLDHVSDPTLRVSVVATDGTQAIRVEDDGPGVPEQEQAVIRAGEETELAHSAGLGLWLVDWVTSLSGGSVDFEESSLGGTAVVLSFPAVDAE